MVFANWQGTLVHWAVNPSLAKCTTQTIVKGPFMNAAAYVAVCNIICIWVKALVTVFLVTVHALLCVLSFGWSVWKPFSVE